MRVLLRCVGVTTIGLVTGCGSADRASLNSPSVTGSDSSLEDQVKSLKAEVAALRDQLGQISPSMRANTSGNDSPAAAPQSTEPPSYAEMRACVLALSNEGGTPYAQLYGADAVLIIRLEDPSVSEGGMDITIGAPSGTLIFPLAVNFPGGAARPSGHDRNFLMFRNSFREWKCVRT